MGRKRKVVVINKEEIIEFFSDVVSGRAIKNPDGSSELPNLSMRFKAAELLGKSYGLFSDKVNFEGNLPIIISGEDKIEI